MNWADHAKTWLNGTLVEYIWWHVYEWWRETWRSGRWGGRGGSGGSEKWRCRTIFLERDCAKGPQPTMPIFIELSFHKELDRRRRCGGDEEYVNKDDTTTTTTMLRYLGKSSQIFMKIIYFTQITFFFWPSIDQVLILFGGGVEWEKNRFLRQLWQQGLWRSRRQRVNPSSKEFFPASYHQWGHNLVTCFEIFNVLDFADEV